ncbi:MAG: hypothetical protein KatS3mg068_1036 [Candidatus Sericytochromatia bacterium]|nr:MAG: hypothetical protein KatS3mg068_1036 [Candidatus Sericytochromatia bacterium]
MRILNLKRIIGRASKLNLFELITLGVYRYIISANNWKSYYQTIERDYRVYFPDLPYYNFVKEIYQFNTSIINVINEGNKNKRRNIYNRLYIFKSKRFYNLETTLYRSVEVKVILIMFC